MSKSVAIIQSNYIPWKGYFNIIKCVDEFVLLDDVQYTRRDWRNRNLIKTAGGLKWLTIPVDVKGQYHIRIKEVTTTGNDWRLDHWRRIEYAYAKAPYFEWFAPLLEDLYLNHTETNLSEVNYSFIEVVNRVLDIRTPIRWSTEFDVPEEKSERLLEICKALNATDYVSGTAARGYLDVSLFVAEGVHVRWADYANYTEYNQLHGSFEHGVSVIDLIFNEGPNARRFLKEKIWT